MTRKLPTVAGLAVLLFAAGTVWHFGSVRATEHSQGHRVQEFLGFGLRVAGTYVADITQGDFQGTGFLNLHADGTYELSDTSDFGAGGGSLTLPTYGSWRSTGPRSLVAREGFMLFDPETGELSGTVILVADVDFDEGFDTADATFTAKFVPAGQDPLDPDAGFPVAPGTVSLRRLTVP